MTSSTSNGEGKRRRDAMRAAAGRWPATPRPISAPAREPAPRASSKLAGNRPRIFVSYSREDTAVVRDLVVRLRNGGAHVTWDQDFVAGSDFERAICEAIDAAHAVIVAWSPASVRSRYVHDEAQRALSASKLITTHVEGFEFSDVPLGFGRLHTIPLDDQDLIRKSLADRGIMLRS